MRMSARGDGFGIALLLLVVAAYAPPGAAQPCFSNIKGQGMIVTPNFYATNNPGANLPVSGGGQCQWTLTPAAGKQGKILFNVFDLAPGATLSIYQGTNTTVAPLTQYTGKGPKGGVIPFSGVVSLVFVDADLSFSKGFQLAFYSVEPSLRGEKGQSGDSGPQGCVESETLVSAGSVASPGHPGLYPVNSKCTWILMPCEPGAQIEVQFTYMDLETNADTVTLTYDTSGLIEKGPYSGTTLPPDFTAPGPITVTFESDEFESSNKGFALQFHTVPIQGTPSDPLANPEACDALCPADKTEDPSSHCFAHDDPHILRFDSVGYSTSDDFQKPGVYYLYKHKTAPVSVQAAFQPCETWPGAFCVCAVAVRYCDEVFVVDRCYTQTPPGQSDKLYRAGSSYAMNIQPGLNGQGWTVSLPTGLRVDIGRTTEWIGTVDLHDSLVNKNASEGMCRDVYRCGTSKPPYDRSYDSWWVHAEESSFTDWKQTPRSTCKISTCVRCSLTHYTVPKEVVDMEKVNAQYSDSNNFLHKSPGARGNTGAIGAKGEIGPAPRFVAPWTAQRAFLFCHRSLQYTPEMQECNRLLRRPTNLDNDIATCISDIQITGTTDFFITAKQASISTCTQALKNAGIDPRPVLSLTCPNDCSGNGVCNKGVCSCFPGRYDTDCSLIIPKLDNTTAEVNCPANAAVSGVCLLQYVYGQNFIEFRSRTPSCNITYQAVNRDGLPTRFNFIVMPATYFNATTVLCQLPSGEQDEYVTYTISISNDGALYSNNVTTYRIFVPVCGQTFVGSGILRSPNYPASYPNNVSCIWNLIATAGKSVLLTFVAFNLEYRFDVLRCSDHGQLIDTFTGKVTSPPKYYGASLRCVFTSDKSITASGFNITFNSYVPEARCGGSVTRNATIDSPGYPKIGFPNGYLNPEYLQFRYPNNIYCLWTLTATPGKVLKLQFIDFGLEAGHDYLLVFTGGSLYASLTGFLVPADYTLQSTATLVFRSDQSVRGPGFRIAVMSV